MTRVRAACRLVAVAACAAALGASASSACSMFAYTDGSVVLFANNEDYVESGVLWFVPAGPGRHGRVNLGFGDDFAQGSMNEKGLCFDAAVVPEVPWAADPSKHDTPNLLELILDTRATVDEALRLFDEYNCAHLARSQFLFADATGASAVVTWDPANRLSVVRKDGPYQLITNDRVAWSGYRDPRFMLGARGLAALGPRATPQACAAVLDAMHQEGRDAFTSYSNVFDLTHRRVHLFQHANFDEMVTLDLEHELKQGRRTVPLSKLFRGGRSVRQLRGAPPRKYETEIAVAPERLARYAGNYEVRGADVRIRVAVDGTRGLTFQVLGQREVAMFAETERKFRFRESFGQVTFDVAENGETRGLTLHRPGDAYAERAGP